MVANLKAIILCILFLGHCVFFHARAVGQMALQEAYNSTIQASRAGRLLEQDDEALVQAVANFTPRSLQERKLLTDAFFHLAERRRQVNLLSKAAEYYGKAYETLKQGGAPANSLYMLNQNWVRTLMQAGRYAESSVAIEQAKKHLKGISDPIKKAQRTAETYRIEGELHRLQRRIHEAEKSLQAAVKEFGKLIQFVQNRPSSENRNRYLGDLKRLEAITYAQLALICANGERDGLVPIGGEKSYSELADEYFQTALKFFQKYLPKNSDTARIQNDYAHFLHTVPDSSRNRKPDYQAAKQYYEKALKIYRNLDHLWGDTADTRHNLAQLALRQGKVGEAMEQINHAAKALDKAGNSINAEYRMKIEYMRSKVLWEQKEMTQALETLESAMNIALQQRAQGGGGSLDRARYFSMLTNPVERSLEWRAELTQSNFEDAESHASAALYDIERTRGLSILEEREFFKTMAERKVSKKLQKEEYQTGKDVSLSVNDWIDAMYGSDKRGKALEEAVKNTEEIAIGKRVAHQEVMRRIWNNIPLQERAIKTQSYDKIFSDVQKFVQDRNAILLEYYVGKKGVYVLIITPSQAWIEKLQISPEEIEQKVSFQKGMALHTLSAKDASNRNELDERLRQGMPLLNELWNTLIPGEVRHQLSHESSSYNRLYLIPDGPLASLPFEALVVERDGAGQPTYLLEKAPPIVYCLSSFALLSLANFENVPPQTIHPLIIGDPVYRHKSMQFVDWEMEIHFGQEEIESLEDSMQKQGLKPTVLSRAGASEQKFRREAPNHEWLILSCHGVSAGTEGYLSSFLLLSHGNNEQPESDGLLDLSELSEIDLDNCQLVVLSACQGNLGKQFRGEGAWSIARGFQVAGAKRVVSTNWEVDYLASRYLIEVFLSELQSQQQKGIDYNYAKALKSAKLALLKGVYPGYEIPFNWAGFTMIGTD